MTEKTIRARELMGRKCHFLTKLIAEISLLKGNTSECTAKDFSHAFTIFLRVKATVLVLVEREK